MEYRAVFRDPDAASEVRDGIEDNPFRLHAVDMPIFSALEEQVIALACMDRMGSLEPPGPIDRLMKLLFGIEPKSRALADPRLELLRRAVVVGRHRHHLPDMQAAELRQNGFSIAQVREIERRAIAG
jgi:hypothetical protein